MEIEVELLGMVNDFEKTNPPLALQRKYILKVTAEQLSQLLRYTRKSKSGSAAFKIEATSVIQVDKKIQRGLDAEGYLLQNPKKIMEITNTLLDPRKETIPRLYLSSLTWNVRPKFKKDRNEDFRISKIEKEGKPPQYRLNFETESIYLTDSAHRHLGIVEAYLQYRLNPDKYPSFSPKMEFSVELYTLPEQQERELFAELNSKQKKISAAKQKEMDVSSPIGALKDAIQDYDRQNRKLFDKNIEVTSNQNDKHTLLTMSVFHNSIGEMFSNQQIKDSRDDSDLQQMLSEYYCEFFYELSNTLVVQIESQDGSTDQYHPYRNLYIEYIKPVEDNYDPHAPASSEEKLQTAREKATSDNQSLRKIDAANHNSFVKAFARLGGKIRLMDNWRDVIVKLQTQLNFRKDLAMFQKSNKDLFETQPKYGIPIASLNEDGTINIQVQSKTINAIYDYLIEQLDLQRNPELLVKHQSEDHIPMSNGMRLEIPELECYSAIIAYFYLPSSITQLDEGSVRLDIDCGRDFPAATKKNKTGGLAPSFCSIDEGYTDRAYPDINRWEAKFELHWPSNNKMTSSSSTSTLRLIYPAFNDPSDTEKFDTEFTVVKTK
jgi:hypothetical protein